MRLRTQTLKISRVTISREELNTILKHHLERVGLTPEGGWRDKELRITYVTPAQEFDISWDEVLDEPQPS